MRKYLILPTALICAACMTVPTRKQEAQEFANKLETENDPIQVIEAYNMYKGLCRQYWSNKYPSQEECIKRDALVELDTDIVCVGLPTSYNSSKKYDSDECILYRRSEKFHKSEVNYFDYKRFLGKSSVIKTDDDFLKLVNRFEKISECDKMHESTTDEKEACKENQRNEIRKLAKREISCMEWNKEEYINKLKDIGKYYEWAIDHDPYEKKRLFIAFGLGEAAQFMYEPVLSKEEAQAEIKEAIHSFGDTNFCSINGWEQEIKKLGYKLN